MKKIYMMPNCQVIKVTLTTMIATSTPDVIVDDTEEVDADKVESRRHNDVWDDEDEEDEEQ